MARWSVLSEGGGEVFSLNKDIWDILRVELRMLAEANLGDGFISFAKVFHIPYSILPLARDSPKCIYIS